MEAETLRIFLENIKEPSRAAWMRACVAYPDGPAENHRAFAIGYMCGVKEGWKEALDLTSELTEPLIKKLSSYLQPYPIQE